MDSTKYTDPRFLTSNQQDLLQAALVSNKSDKRTANKNGTMTTTTSVIDPYGAVPGMPGADALNNFNFDDPAFASYLDGDTSFDIDNTDLSGVYQDQDNGDIHDKRKILELDDDEEEGDNKRQEGDDKQAKKPGRKPLTSEPTTKRKAQNRAAQRAFRERKEQHLKDLETKVAELTKVTEHDKQENGILRAQVARLTTELKDYRKRMTTDAARDRSPRNAAPTPFRNEFAFEFPAFGTLPQAQFFGADNNTVVKREGSGSPNAVMPPVRQDSAGRMNTAQSTAATKPSPTANGSRHDSNASHSNSMQSFAGLFSPGLLNGAASSGQSPDYGFPRASASPTTQPLKDDGTTNSGIARAFRFNSESATSNTNSPSQSSMSQFNAQSSANTSPAPSHPSPPKDAVPNGNPGLTSNDLSTVNSLSTPSTTNGIDWLASQNGGQFDPVLFGDYRESQDAIVGDGEFNNGFFNEAFPFDFGSPLNFSDTKSPRPITNNLPQHQQQQQQIKPTGQPANGQKSAACQQLLAQVAQNQSGGNDDYGLNASTFKLNPGNASMLSANTIWNQLQTNKDFQDGKFDLDGLCSELRSKAKCSESGVVVPAADVEDAFKKMGTEQDKDHSLIWDEAFVDEAVEKLGGRKMNWGGFGL